MFLMFELSSLRSRPPRVAKHCGQVAGRHNWNIGLPDGGQACARQKLRPYKIPLIPISCRISETLSQLDTFGGKQ